ncbi:MAG: ATP phosphoribosyltransferase regulatory subunit [Chloroflexi bacterium]|nr:MAG: ATP phosphoribosyltransferase regulatory subunit [Chloroflexota bacterium]
METQRCKGSRDLLPEDMAKFRHIEHVFRSSCLGWGYEEIRTPTLEYLHLFTSVGTLTPEMLSRVYSFLDWDGWSGERVVLRPDGTIPAARLYIENLAGVRPARLFYVENVFTFEETGRESRERWQCGAEIVGSARPLADVELIALALDVLDKLGIQGVRLHLSHAGVIASLLARLGLTSAEQAEAFNRILAGNSESLRDLIGAAPQLKDAVSLLFEVKGESAGYLRNLQALLGRPSPDPDLDASMNDFIAIADSLTGLRHEYEIDIATGKGFEYYTGIIFRFYLDGRVLGGGGRYDGLVPLLGGGAVPASGFALRIDRLMEHIAAWEEVKPSVLVRSEVDGTAVVPLCFEVAGLLRKAGHAVELDQGYTGPTAHRWVVSLQGTAASPRFAVADRASGATVQADSPAQVVEAVGKCS